jgi:hypothetical protein
MPLSDWDALFIKHVIRKQSDCAKLVQDLKFLQMVRSPDFPRQPGFSGMSENALSLCRKMAQETENRILQAVDNSDAEFVRQVSEALKAIAEKKPFLFNATGVALVAWDQLRAELGHRPNRDELQTRVEQQWRKYDEKTWRDVFRDIKVLFRRVSSS